ncbi:hypothetical protein [Kutzneria buriramensis]|uniref:hypothetical protein n=1 Tax=Kutzneria buriramensis TaxID=1045776 RepID=UPI000E258846|nr:hypothetical protein [Kutzneria buriramensis]
MISLAKANKERNNPPMWALPQPWTLPQPELDTGRVTMRRLSRLVHPWITCAASTTVRARA